MLDRRAVIAAYERIEAEAGGLAFADAKKCAEQTAQEFGLTYEEVRGVLVQHWARLGA